MININLNNEDNEVLINIKSTLNAQIIRITHIRNKPVKKK